ncbi:MAG: O-antigen ligase family protein [bacterium]
MKFLIYLLIISAFWGSAIFDLKLSEGLSIFPYRVLLIFIFFIILLKHLYQQGKLKISHIKIKNYIVFLILWVFYAIFSLAWSQDYIATLKNIVFLSTNVGLIIVIVYYLKSLDDMKRFYSLWLIMLLFVMIPLGLWNMVTGQQLIEFNPQYLSYTQLQYYDYYEKLYRYIPRATFTNQNDYATYLALSIPFVITFIRYSSSGIKKLLGLGLLLLCLFLLIFTTSRANYIAVIIGFFFWFLFLVRTFKRKIKIAAFLSVASVSLLLIFSNRLELTFETFNTNLTSLLDIVVSGSNEVRVNLIKNSLVFVFNSFGFGVGAGNSLYYMQHHAVYDTEGMLNVHNWWFEILTDYGVFIFIGYVIFYISLFINLYNSYRKLENNEEKKICEALLISLISFFFSSTSSSSILNSLPQWILFSFGLGFLNYHRLKMET